MWKYKERNSALSFETYGLCLNYQSGKFFQRHQKEMVKILYQACESNNQLFTSQPGHAIIILHKGQIIPPEGFKKRFTLSMTIDTALGISS